MNAGLAKPIPQVLVYSPGLGMFQKICRSAGRNYLADARPTALPQCDARRLDALTRRSILSRKIN
jgi:hypothetical protein